MNVRVSEIPYSDLHHIVLASVGPRPIAWVSTVSADGQPNLAPFSFFNCVCMNPPLLAIATSLRGRGGATQGEPKDTLHNVRETKEFVVNVVTYDLREPMNTSSGEYERTVNEWELAKVTPQPSQAVRPARVGESPVSFECKLYQILDFSTAPNGGSLIIGEVVSIHVSDAYVKDGRLDRNSLDLIGRMGGMQYARTTERFDLVRPKV